MRLLSLFAGIGGFDLGLERAGHECVGQVEIDPACQRVLAERFPHAARWIDVREWQGNGNEHPDALVGGFPCQDLSVAGKRAGLKGERSSLFWEIVRIAKAITPTWGLFENVPGLISSHGGRDFWSVLSGLRECWPVVGYRILDSQFFGVAQRRRRVFFVCGPSERGVREVLFEPESRGGDSATGAEAGTRVAAAVGGGAYGTGRATEDDPNLVYGVGTGDGGADDNDAQAERLIVNQAISSKWAKGSSGPAGGKPGQGCPSVRTGAMVRRLTPTECERLQSFPDGWTDVPGSSDSTRYRQLGNAVTVNVAEWLGKRLAEVEERRPSGGRKKGAK